MKNYYETLKKTATKFTRKNVEKRAFMKKMVYQIFDEMSKLSEKFSNEIESDNEYFCGNKCENVCEFSISSDSHEKINLY